MQRVRGYCTYFLALLVLVFVTACVGEEPPAPVRGYPSYPGAVRELPPGPAGQSGPGREVKVALLVPLSGTSAAIGNEMLDAAMLAIYDKYGSMHGGSPTANVKILPKDTQGTPEGAKAAAKAALDEGAALILGPLFAADVQTVAPVAHAKKVPVIAFSNNRTVMGPGVFLFGFMPEQQVARVAAYALDHDIARFAALAPSNPYGTTVMDAFSNTVRMRGGRIAPLEFYADSSENLHAEVVKISRILESEKAYPAGLFIPEGGRKLAMIARSIATARLDTGKVRLMGTGLWDTKDTLAQKSLTGAWFASGPPEKYRGFEKRFEASYHYQPQRIASLAYDAVALATTLAMAPGEPNFTEEALTDPVGFAGPANGVFRFQKNGICERALAVIEITPGGFKAVSAAPMQFEQ